LEPQKEFVGEAPGAQNHAPHVHQYLKSFETAPGCPTTALRLATRLNSMAKKPASRVTSARRVPSNGRNDSRSPRKTAEIPARMPKISKNKMP
jgi:hypothetical protein